MHSINGSWSSLTWLMEKERKQTRSGNKNAITNSKKKKKKGQRKEGKARRGISKINGKKLPLVSFLNLLNFHYLETRHY